MPISTSTGRAVKEILNDASFARIGKNAVSKTCIIVDRLLKEHAADLKIRIDKEDWQGLYANLTYLRRMIEIREESCP